MTDAQRRVAIRQGIAGARYGRACEHAPGTDQYAVWVTAYQLAERAFQRTESELRDAIETSLANWPKKAGGEG